VVIQKPLMALLLKAKPKALKSKWPWAESVKEQIMKNRYQEGGPIDEMEEANNRPQIVSRRRPMMPMPSPNDESGKLQNLISSGSDIVGRPQDEGYRPNAGTASERAMLEGARDYGKITESGDQGFGGPGSSRVVKAMPKAMPKPAARDTGSDMARMMNRGKSAEMPSGSPGRGKSAEMPADVTKMSANDRMKRSIETNLSGARKGSGTTDKRSVTDRIKASFGMKSGGMTASSRGDGIAQRGKTRGKMC
jgi:hypothetical protein